MESACYVKMTPGTTVADLRQALEVQAPANCARWGVAVQQSVVSGWLLEVGCH